MSTDLKVGAWTPFRDQISKEERQVFDNAFKGFVGVSYTPLAVSTQIVAGTNYCYFCNSKGAYPGANNEPALVTIYQPLEGHPHITAINRCH